MTDVSFAKKFWNGILMNNHSLCVNKGKRLLVNLVKSLLPFLFALSASIFSYADDFTDLLQDLAVQTVCIGQYSATQAGGGWYDDPHDYYTPQMMAQRLASMSGNQTKTDTFYGVCFNYA